ncbi:MAG: OmpA family protein, partial [Saprospiraceae bacterium]
MMKITIAMMWFFASSHLHSQSVKDSLLEIYAGQVFFETNKSDIEDGYKGIIKSLCDSFPNTKGKYFFIKAHTDAVGNRADNLSLSEKRSLSIKMVLIANGIPESDIQTEYYGDQKPQSDNHSEEGKRLNRRAGTSVRDCDPIQKR